jgi:hypothetical protein
VLLQRLLELVGAVLLLLLLLRLWGRGMQVARHAAADAVVASSAVRSSKALQPVLSTKQNQTAC